MGKWTYVGQVHQRGVLMQDGTIQYPHALDNDAQIDALLAKYPDLQPWFTLSRNTNATGSGDAHYVHQQATPTTRWNIVHNLGKIPAITVVDSAGTEVEGAITHDMTSMNMAEVIFTAPFSGRAICN